MKEIRHIVEDIQAVFAQSSYPVEFLAAYDQMECLSSHSGRETFLIQEKATGRPAVAKCYDRTLFPFQPDYSFLADLDHPGLPKFLGEYHNEQMLCIVREYIEGEPLSERAGENDMSQEEILSVTDQLCGILEALHSHNPPIIHRDIKPENVIIRPDGTAVLIDFDISRSFSLFRNPGLCGAGAVRLRADGQPHGHFRPGRAAQVDDDRQHPREQKHHDQRGCAAHHRPLHRLFTGCALRGRRRGAA